MKKIISTIFLTLTMIAILLTPVMAAGAAVTGEYSQGVVKVLGSSLEKNMQYSVIAIKDSKGKLIALGKGEADSGGSLSASITTGTIENADTYKVYIYNDDGGEIVASGAIKNKSSSSSGGSSGGGGASSSRKSSSDDISISVKPKVSDNTLSAAVSTSQMNYIIKKLQEKTEEKGTSVEINIDDQSITSNNLVVTLQQTGIDAFVDAEIKEVNIISEIANIKLDIATLKVIKEKSNSDISIFVKKLDKRILSGKEKAIIGDHPVYNLSLSSNGEKVTDFGNGTITISFPYELAENENAKNIVIYYISDKGEIKEMANSVYDENAKTVSFTTNHFSKFAIGYKGKTEQINTNVFRDISEHWAKENIEFVVEKGLFAGTTNTTFSPDAPMTRGMFVTVLYRLAGTPQVEENEFTFVDVNKSAYYADAVYYARDNGIVKGITADSFAPNTNITREQMAVIINNYLKAAEITIVPEKEKIIFADYESISGYAIDAVKAMQLGGILNGKENDDFDPQGITTRAEVATVLRKVIELNQ